MVLKTVNDTIQRALYLVMQLLLAFLVAVVFAEVVSRNIFKVPIIWAQDAALFAFVWCTFLGAAVGLRQQRHFVVDVFPPGATKVRLVFKLLGNLMMFALVYVLVVYGWHFTQMGLKRFSESLGVTQAYFFAAIPIGGLAMFTFLLENTWHDLNKLLNPQPGDSPVKE